MKLNKYPYSHGVNANGETVDASTLQAEKDNVAVLTLLNNNFTSLKLLQDTFYGKTITNADSISTYPLGDLDYKCGYRNTATTALYYTNPTVTVLPGEVVYYIGTTNEVRQYIVIAQPYQTTYDPVIDKNGKLGFTKNTSGGDFYTRDIQGPMSNAV